MGHSLNPEVALATVPRSGGPRTPLPPWTEHRLALPGPAPPGQLCTGLDSACLHGQECLGHRAASPGVPSETARAGSRRSNHPPLPSQHDRQPQGLGDPPSPRSSL